MDKKLLDIICCPVSRTPLRLLKRTELDALNRAIAEGSVDYVTGKTVNAPLSEGLISMDNKIIYRVEDDIPVLLADEGIGTTQLKSLA